MTTVGQFNTKNPTIKRILKEASELASNPSHDFHAAPLDTNLFEWHFTLRGPPSSPFAQGIYHGRILLPPTYPLRPPSFRFSTPSGRFEVNREICLSISGHHEETWQPAWGVRTALVALRSFMETDVGGQVGGLQSDGATRKQLAVRSGAWLCSGCGKTNAQIMQEADADCASVGASVAATKLPGTTETRKEEVPAELRLAYREDLDTRTDGKAPTTSTSTSTSNTQTVRQQARPNPTRVAVRSRSQPDAWLDKAIYILGALLAFLVLRKVMSIVS